MPKPKPLFKGRFSSSNRNTRTNSTDSLTDEDLDSDSKSDAPFEYRCYSHYIQLSICKKSNMDECKQIEDAFEECLKS